MKNESVAISYCINIPEGATNGEVIKAAFPNIPLDSDDYFVRDMYDNIRCWKDWWNAPYKAESEDKE